MQMLFLNAYTVEFPFVDMDFEALVETADSDT